MDSMSHEFKDVVRLCHNYLEIGLREIYAYGGLKCSLDKLYMT